jgi:hypothetical protein
MGVDAAIFAKKSKRYFYVDREYNILLWDRTENHPEDLNSMFDLAAITWNALKYESFSAANLMIILKATIEATPYTETNAKDYYAKLATKFVELFPDDEFVVTNTNHDEYYEMMNTYKQVEDWELNFP